VRFRSGGSAAVSQDLLLLSGPGVATVVNVTTEKVVYSTPYYISGRLDTAALSTNGNLILRGEVSSGCGNFTNPKECAPGFLISVNIYTRAINYFLNFTNGVGNYMMVDPSTGTVLVDEITDTALYAIGLGSSVPKTVFNTSVESAFDYATTLMVRMSTCVCVLLIVRHGLTWLL